MRPNQFASPMVSRSARNVNARENDSCFARLASFGKMGMIGDYKIQLNRYRASISRLGGFSRMERARTHQAKHTMDASSLSRSRTSAGRPTAEVPGARDVQVEGVSISRSQARRILYSLMVPAMIMPLTSSMSRVALPILRDEFLLPADVVAWVSTAFTLPFMILMPVYGRLSDSVGRRRLLLAGILIFSLGTGVTVFASDLAWLMLGRALQGFGVAGMTPLGMALISAIFDADERGEALGTWSTIGPFTAFVGPFLAGFLVDLWGWRAAFAPPLFIGLAALVVVYQFVPAGLSQIRPDFWRRFDWIGVGLFAAAVSGLLFYLSSRPITGAPPLQDWRLLLATGALGLAFVRWERVRSNPFVPLGLFRIRSFSGASLAAALRMFVMAGSGFLLPLFLVDIHHASASMVGILLMVNPGAMAIMVRLGGTIADRWGSRWPVLLGLTTQSVVMAFLGLGWGEASLGILAGLLAVHGLGVGLMLAALHQAAMVDVDEAYMGAAAGMYSMIRFAGAAMGTALAGVLLQQRLDSGVPVLTAYENVFLALVGVGILGMAASLLLPDKLTRMTR
ncbi:MAG: MFS transporter [Caldilineae bacterium]|nr:MAG: MFS transporter [Caldilineae bacterium]